jgi:hypothetical protein
MLLVIDASSPQLRSSTQQDNAIATANEGALGHRHQEGRVGALPQHGDTVDHTVKLRGDGGGLYPKSLVSSELFTLAWRRKTGISGV